MPLTSAQLAREGIKPSADAAAQLTRLAQAAVLGAQAVGQMPRPAARRPRENRPRVVVAPVLRTPPDGGQRNGQSPHRHIAVRYDAFPPWTDPDTWWYYCDACGSRITGAELKANPILHIAATTRARSTGPLEVVYTQYGRGTSQ